MHNLSAISMFTVLALLGCRPPEAPDTYEDLVGFVFEHAGDESEDELIAGLDNLSAWLAGENLETAEGGVTIKTLPQGAVDGLDDYEHGVDGLAGVSLATDSGYKSTVLMEALTQYSFADMMPDVYTTYEREFDEGQGCIVERDCLWAKGSVYSVADWGALGEVEADRRIEFRWVETEEGWVFLQRWWLLEPSTGTRMNLVISDQYYIGINFPLPDGTRRVHASWINMRMSTGDASTGAANQLIDNWKKDAEDLDVWIDENL
ncbi:MAG: hypothetical protein VX519_12135 [Myxococcota bacterium]|nr:hypothetical protein [Myxococcota bacterium]